MYFTIGSSKEILPSSTNSSTETAMIFGELYKHGSEWKFRAIGQGFAGGLGPLAASFGVAV